ncbi:hypothetical protein SAMN05443549_103114 [Flavobacterium fluvii]|uniref:Uncharacterized protein n=1 Tax=Flavobacterium fluvii TaxID=468056 RepID=A0A1M5IIP5_9FLAO|nr:hypothetical protein [Flavobacterium fluvii]SHG28218.1 hypothetical protein SAMN05443549_103114 [Flavobacterium fluvii]
MENIFDESPQYSFKAQIQLIHTDKIIHSQETGQEQESTTI